MTLRLTDAEQTALRERAELEGISMQEAAPRAVRYYVTRGRGESIIYGLGLGPDPVAGHDPLDEVVLDLVIRASPPHSPTRHVT